LPSEGLELTVRVDAIDKLSLLSRSVKVIHGANGTELCDGVGGFHGRAGAGLL